MSALPGGISRFWIATGRRAGRWAMPLLFLLFVTGAIGTMWDFYSRTEQLHRDFPLQGSALNAATVTAFRQIYTEDVVQRAERFGMRITHDLKGHPDDLPLPATLTMKVGDRLNEFRTGAHLRLYSDYPFPWRKDRAPLDDFEREALSALRTSPDQPFYRFEEFEGRPSLRYAVADRMKARCVDCHNSHPDSPKRNWQVGDVRGVLEFIRPLDATEAAESSSYYWGLGLMMGMSGLGLGGLALIYYRLRRASAALAARTSKLEVVNRSLEQEIEDRIRAERELEATHQHFMAASRRAGMAEIASGVLHNVGNVLNSVNVSATLVLDRLKQSKLDQLMRVSGLIEQHHADLGKFITEDPKGMQVPGFLKLLAGHLADERAQVLDELDSLHSKVEHIKTIVATQQSYAGVSGVVEPVDLTLLLDDAVKMNASSFEKHGIEVERDFADLPELLLDKQKLLQILVNLVKNAKDAVMEQPGGECLIRLCTRPAGDRIQIVLTDTGVGIAAENMTRIFSHGFTTKKTGHGFGLHSCANSAREMGGLLTVESDGPGTGATFTLEVPFQPAAAPAFCTT